MARLILAFVLAIGLAACNRSSKTADVTGLPATSPPPSGALLPPTISGIAPTSVKADTAYSFQPLAASSTGAALRFTIQNKPVWANFNASTGLLSGTPGVSNIGHFAGIFISVTDGTASSSLGVFSIDVTSVASAVTISGTPQTSIVAGNSYSFVPAASSPSGSALTFSIQNKPPWASFDASTGELSGTPTLANVGTTRGIVIGAVDGTTTVALPAFSIDVTQIGMGSATLTWMPPTQNKDGTPLTNLAGYRVLYGTSAAALTQTAQVSNPGIVTYMVGNLSPGTWYFTVKAYTAANIESDASGMVSTAIL